MQLRPVAERVWAITAGSFPSNNYVCATGCGNRAVVIDVGLDPEAVEAALDHLGFQLAGVYSTHGHFDHIGGAASLQARHDVPVVLHRADVKTARQNNFLLMAMKFQDRVTLPDITEVEDGFEIDIDGAKLTYRHMPGHTPGSCAIFFGDGVFTGDSIYSYGVGLSKLPGERADDLRTSIRALWPELAGRMIHPGHGDSAAANDVMTNNEPLLRFLGGDPMIDRQP